MLSLYPESIYAGWLFKNEVSGVIEGLRVLPILRSKPEHSITG